MAKSKSELTAMETKLNRIAKIASEDGKAKIYNVVHMLNVENLKECFYQKVLVDIKKNFLALRWL